MDLDAALARIKELESEGTTKDAKITELSGNLTSQRTSFDAEKKELETKVGDLEKAATERTEKDTQELTDYKDKRIELISKGDKAIKDKIEAEYGVLNLGEATRDEIDARALKAYQIATATTTDPLAQRAEGEITEHQAPDDAKLTSGGAEVFKRMFPESKVLDNASGDGAAT